MSQSKSLALKQVLVLAMLALVIFSALQADLVEGSQKSDLIFVKGKFIKKDKKGVIVVEEKEHCGCGHKRR